MRSATGSGSRDQSRHAGGTRRKFGARKPHYDVRRVRDDQTDLPENAGVSYSLAEVETEAEVPQSIEGRSPRPLQSASSSRPPARVPPPLRSGRRRILVWLTGLFKGDGEADEEGSKKRRSARRRRSRATPGGRDQKRGRGRGGERKQADDRQRSKKKTTSKRPRRKAASKSRRQQDQDRQDKPQQQGQQRRSRKSSGRAEAAVTQPPPRWPQAPERRRSARRTAGREPAGRGQADRAFSAPSSLSRPRM